MPTHTGQYGVIISNGIVVAEVRSFNADITADLVDSTYQGLEWKDNKGIQKSWGGSLTCLWDNSGAGQVTLEEGAQVSVELYPSAYPGASFSGDAIITQIGYSSDMSDMILAAVAFVGDGELTIFSPVPPVANAGANQTLADGSTITLDGTATTGTAPITYAWTQVSGPSVTITDDDQATATVTGAPVGNYVFKLTASNSYGSSESTTDVEIEAAVGCTTAWNDDPAVYASVGLPAPVGTITGKAWEIPPSSTSGTVGIVYPDTFNINATPYVVEFGVNYTGSIPTPPGAGQTTFFGIGYKSMSASDFECSIFYDAVNNLEMVFRDANDVLIEVPLGGTDASKITLVSLESFGDSTGVARVVYDGTVVSSPVFPVNTPSGILAADTAPDELDQNLTLTLHSSVDQWELNYPANAQDLCGNTKTPVACATGWSDNPALYQSFGLSFTGVVTGKEWLWRQGVDTSGSVNLLNDTLGVSLLDVQSENYVHEIGLDLAAITTSNDGGPLVCAQFVDAVGALGMVCAYKNIGNNSLYLQTTDTQGVSGTAIPLPANDVTEIKAISIEAVGDGTAVGRLLYDTQTLTTSPFSLSGLGDATAMMLCFTNLQAADFTADLHSSSDQWLISYNSNAQDLCGNTV